MLKLSFFLVLAVVFFKSSVAYPATREVDNRPPFLPRLGLPFGRRFGDFIGNFYPSERFINFEEPIDFYDRYYTDDIPLISDPIPIEHPVPLLPIGFGFPLHFNVSAIRGYLSKVLLPYFVKREGELAHVGSVTVEPPVVHAQGVSLSSVVSDRIPQVIETEIETISEVTPHIVDTTVSSTVVPEITHIVPTIATPVIAEVVPHVEAVPLPAVVPTVVSHTEEAVALPAVVESHVAPTVETVVTAAVEPIVEHATSDAVVHTSSAAESSSHEESVKDSSAHSEVVTDTKETNVATTTF